MDILEKIVANKKQEVAEAKNAVGMDKIKTIAAATPPCRGFRSALEKSGTGIIAEFKRHSPSKGWIFEDADPAEVVAGYEAAGAAACSVLTDRDFFKARCGDFAAARQAAALPLLRKEFIVDEFQVYETKAMQADAILLIASVLDRETCARFAKIAREIGLDTILEIHDASELAYVDDNISILGINNRHLGSFHTDVENSFDLAEQMNEIAGKLSCPPLLISESGIKDMQTIIRLREAGFRGFLIGETFMKTHKPSEKLKEFLNDRPQ